MKAAKDKVCNIFTDSRYAFDVCHATGRLWKERGFITATGKKIVHGELIKELIEAVELPKAVSIIHCRGHQKGMDPVVKGNRTADQAAREAALRPAIEAVQRVPQCRPQEYKISEKEKEKFILMGAEEKNGILVMPDQRIAVPKALLRPMILDIHQSQHVGALAIANILRRNYYAPGSYAEAQRITFMCEICQKVNAKTNVCQKRGARPWAFSPFERVQVDYTEMPKVGHLKYLLVIVDQLTGWPEVFATLQATAKTTAKILLEEIILQFDPPHIIESNQGKHFKNNLVQTLTAAIGRHWAYHVPWCPESSGQVERMMG